MDSFVPKKKGLRRIPTALGSGKPATPKNNAHPSGGGCIGCLQKIYQIQSRQIQSFIYSICQERMQYAVPHNKGNQFFAICNYLSVLGAGRGVDCRKTALGRVVAV